MSMPYIETYRFIFHQEDDMHIVQTLRLEASTASGQSWGEGNGGGPVEHGTDPKEVLRRLVKQVISNEEPIKAGSLVVEVIGAGSVISRDEASRVIVLAGLTPVEWRYL